MSGTSTKMRQQILCVLLSLFTFTVYSAPVNDEHYTHRGFFDIHVCNWPDRPLFFMAIFSTAQYKQLKSVSIYDTKNEKIAELNLMKFRIIPQKHKPAKKAFISQISIPESAKNGWYTAKARFKDNSTITARDYVVISRMPGASPVSPTHGRALPTIPDKLVWQPIAGAQFYQVFIRDLWQDNKLIYQSPLLKTPYLDTKDIGLKPGGYYQWKIHARDVNEHILLGDFNHGSLSRKFEFSIE